jgi:hypothetical protein
MPQAPRHQFGRAKLKAPPAPKRILAPRDLPAKGIHFHPNYLRKLWQKGKFPKPFKPSEHRIAWTEEAIDAWIDSKVSEVA